MEWTETAQHSYNTSIPYKKEALQKYCDKKGYKMIWLEYEMLKKIYKSL